jgi:putative Mn2+ efflux pump MntP
LQSLGIATKVIAASMALSAFSLAIVSGLAAGNPARTVLVNAVVCMVACQFLGLFVGMLAERAIADHIASYKSARPIPGAQSPHAPAQKNSTSG